MGIKHFFHELKAKVTASRLFKALVTDSHKVIPKATDKIKSIDIVEGQGVAPGCVLQTNFAEGGHFKYIKHRIDEIDVQNHVIKYTLFEGDALGDKLEKICYELKIEDSPDGGCVLKQKSEYHTKGDIELSEEDIKAGKEQAADLYKACEDYLAANPDVCA